MHSFECSIRCGYGYLRFLFTFFLLMFFQAALASPSSLVLPPANPDGDLRIELVTAYNLIVDSNVESPSSYAPKAFHAGAKICNDGTDTLWNVLANIGDFGAGSPGIYPSRSHPGLTGTFSFTHSGGSSGTADATRYVPFIPPGECVMQYWLLSYPRLDDNGNSVTGGAKPDDDLWLEFDVWATADDNGTPLIADDTQVLYMRSEISAMANKIWPNGDNKVPDIYKQAIEQTLGWDVDSASLPDLRPGEVFAMQGIWYDLGKVGDGFDNDGDFIPDRNLWLQPVGDAEFFNPDCYRLVGCFGLIIVKVNDGTELLIPFENQLYFEHIPANNTGAVGLVFYQFAAVGGDCTGGLSPYQEVASGYQNEKFNADYGSAIPFPSILSPEVYFLKNVDKTVFSGGTDTLTYTFSFGNTGGEAAGEPDLGIPVVIEDAIPAGVTYVAGSAAAGNTLPTGVDSYTILYSTDNGVTWSVTEPPAASVTNLQWILSDPLLPAASGSITFEVEITVLSGTIVCNDAGIRYGTSAPFAEDSACTLSTGNNSLGQTVWADDGGTTGTIGDGIKNGDEAGISNIPVSLYYDFNLNGEIDASDILWGIDTTDVSGNYLFPNLPDGLFILEVCDTCVKNISTYTGWGNTTETSWIVALDTAGAVGTGIDSLSNDFGFAPALTVTKILNTGTPDYEGREVSYTIRVDNLLPPPDASLCKQTSWATAINSGETFIANNPNNALGTPDDSYAFGSRWNNFSIAGEGFSFSDTSAAISKVELVFQFYHSQPLINETMHAEFLLESGGVFTTSSVQVSTLNEYVGAANVGLVVFDVTAAQNWYWSNFDALWYSKLKLVKTTSGDGSTPYVDAIGVRITPVGCTASLAFDEDITLSPVPLTDDYDPSKLEFVSANPPPDSLDETNGSIYWNNVGPVNGQQERIISLTFKALQPSNLVQGDTTNNIALVENAYFVNGDPANSDTDTTGLRILRSGSVAGVVWSDVDADGWQGTTGYEVGVDRFVPNATVVLHTCTNVANNGTCNGTETTDTTFTDANGAYLFEGLAPNFHYSVELIPGSLPGTVTQRGDPDDDPVNGSGNGGLCGSGGSNAACDALWNNNKAWFEVSVDSWGGNSWDVTNINFGYSVNPTIFGTVWKDWDGDGTQETGEEGVAGVTVELRSASCTPGVNCPTAVTNADGEYVFTNRTAGTAYTVVVLTSTLPAGGTWSETAESDGTINNSISVTPLSGQISGPHQFGFSQTGASVIGDKLYYDWDADGFQGASEEPIPDVTLYLCTDINGDGIFNENTDAFVDSTFTNASGEYFFTSLPAGNFIVKVDETDPDFPGDVYQSGDPDEPGDICVTCNGLGTATVNGTNSVLTVDFGYAPIGNATIGDLVWYDANGNGSKGVSEPGLQNVTVQLWADLNADGTYSLMETTTSNASGYFIFENLPNGNFKIVVDSTDADLPEDGSGTTYSPTTATVYNVTVTNGAVASINGTPCSNCSGNAEFGFAPLGAIGDMIFWDANGNGTQDWNEDGVGGVTVYLCSGTMVPCNSGNAIATTTTSDGSGGTPAGYYRFNSLDPGTYTIGIETTSGPLSGAPQTADPNSDGIACGDPQLSLLSYPACDNAYSLPVSYGSVVSGADFGYQPMGVIGDYVWFDQNGDGSQGSGEPGLGDVIVILSNQTAVTISGVPYGAGAYRDTVYTDLDGGYVYQNLPDGTYSIFVETPVNLTVTSGAQSVGATTVSVVLSGGSVSSIGGAGCSNCDLNVDFGFELNGANSISGSLCLDDAPADGLCGGPGDTALDSIPVYLYDDEGTFLGTTLTDASGNYTFSNLPSDTFIVSVGTTISPLDLADVTTTAAQTPAISLTETAASVYQAVPLTGPVTGLDFAFELVIDLDFGDLPDFYKTTLAEGGPRHIVPASPTRYLGASLDFETNGQPSTAADGDGADEDGVSFLNINSWTNGTAASGNGGSLEVVVAGGGYLAGWIDFERDSNFVGNLVVDTALAAGMHTLDFDIPGSVDLDSGSMYARFRLFPSAPAFPAFAYTGLANSGEVEDYVFGRQTCPTIDSLISDRVICTGDLVDTLQVLTTQTNPDSIAFVYFSAAQTDSNIIYNSGTGIDTVQVTMGHDTVRLTNVTFPAHSGDGDPDTLFVYAILHPQPAGATCFVFEEIQVIVHQTANAGTAVANDSICLEGSGLSAINLFDKLTGEDSGGAWSVISGSPGANFNAAAATLNPNGLPIDNYTFRYTVTGTPPCPDDSEEWTITVYRCCPPQICLPVSATRNN